MRRRVAALIVRVIFHVTVAGADGVVDVHLRGRRHPVVVGRLHARQPGIVVRMARQDERFYLARNGGGWVSGFENPLQLAKRKKKKKPAKKTEGAPKTIANMRVQRTRVEKHEQTTNHRKRKKG